MDFEFEKCLLCAKTVILAADRAFPESQTDRAVGAARGASPRR